MEFAKQLKLFRKKRGLNQTDLAHKIGVSESSISRYERAEIEPTIGIVIQIASVLGCSIDELVTSKKELNEENLSYIQRLENVMTRLADDDIEGLHRIIEAFEAKSMLNILYNNG